MDLNVIAIIISIVAVLFTVILTLLAFREQRYRLRPHVNVDRIDQYVDANNIIWKLAIKNSGLMIAKNVTISPKLSAGDLSKELDRIVEPPSRAIILPNQVYRNTVGVKGATRAKVLDGSITLKLTAQINYEGAGKHYYFKAQYTYSTRTGSWVFDSGDAN